MNIPSVKELFSKIDWNKITEGIPVDFMVIYNLIMFYRKIMENLKYLIGDKTLLALLSMAIYIMI